MYVMSNKSVPSTVLFDDNILKGLYLLLNI